MISLKQVAALALGGAMIAGVASGAEVARTYGAPTAPIAATVTVPAGYETVYLSGVLPDPATPPANGAPPVWGSTEAQAESAFTKIAALLKGQGLSEGDVVKMTIFMAGDPAMGGKMDFPAMMNAYKRHYGTATQAAKPARSTVQVAALAAPGALLEVEVIAVRKAR